MGPRLRELLQSNSGSSVVDALLPPPPDRLPGLQVAHHAERLAEHAPHVRQLGRHSIHVNVRRIRLEEEREVRLGFLG